MQTAGARGSWQDPGSQSIVTAALPRVVEGFSLLVFTTNWLPSVRLTGPLLDPTEMESKRTSRVH